MATLSWTIDATIGSRTKDSPTYTDQQMDRFLDWIWYAYPQFDVDGETPLPKTNANLAAAFDDWAMAQLRGTIANITRHEQNEAAQAARDAITDLPDS